MSLVSGCLLVSLVTVSLVLRLMVSVVYHVSLVPA